MSSPPAAFHFDLASPLAYLAAERVLQALPGPAEWRPVLSERLRGGAHPPWDEDARRDVEAQAAALGLQPLRWPDPFPFDSSLAMRVATYARSIGRAVPFAQAAFRQAFAGGHCLADADYVLIAAAACEMHPAAVLRAAQLRSVSEQLQAAGDDARRLGVTDVPAVSVGDAVFAGERFLERAAAHMRSGGAAAHARPQQDDARTRATLPIVHVEGACR